MTRIEIQKYTIGGVEHYRAREEGSTIYTLEAQPKETLDQFRWRIMDKYGGCLFVFQPDWII